MARAIEIDDDVMRRLLGGNGKPEKPLSKEERIVAGRKALAELVDSLLAAESCGHEGHEAMYGAAEGALRALYNFEVLPRKAGDLVVRALTLDALHRADNPREALTALTDDRVAAVALTVAAVMLKLTGQDLTVLDTPLKAASTGNYL